MDSREPLLRFLRRKNPHSSHYGDMRLYLQLQIEERAVEVHGSIEKLDEAQTTRATNREKLKQKRYEKKMKDLRRTVKFGDVLNSADPHVHQFGDEIHDAKKDIYYKICQVCQHRNEYEKM